jgi:hypothetical protein
MIVLRKEDGKIGGSVPFAINSKDGGTPLLPTPVFQEGCGQW